MWSWVEQELRKEEKRADTFETFCKKMIMASRRYPAGSALIPSMAQRLEAVLNAKGGMTKYLGPTCTHEDGQGSFPCQCKKCILFLSAAG